MLRGFVLRGKQITAQLAREVRLPAEGSVEELELTSDIVARQLELVNTGGDGLELKFTHRDPRADEQLARLLRVLGLAELK